MTYKDELYRHPPLPDAVDELRSQLDALLVRARSGDPDRAGGRPRDVPAALVDGLYDRLAELRSFLEEGP